MAKGSSVNRLKVFLTIFLGSIMIFLFNFCSGQKKEKINQDSFSEETSFHADNDIAMTVRSLVDAIKVGEKIDSLDYDFIGVLTDGQGTPLYTTYQGQPGVWVVDVLDTDNVSIMNQDLGDLLPEALESYLLGCLDMEATSRVEFSTPDAIDNDDTEVSIYDFGGGFLRFERRCAVAPNGVEGPLLTILISATLPKGVEKQTSV